MATDREDRFATAVDFARALQRVELELGYSPTAIDVPNLQVASPVRDTGEDAGDATKVRSVATIDAQDAPTASAPAPDAPTPTADETVVRGTATVQAQQAPAAASGDHADAPSETIVRRREPATAPASQPAAETPQPRGRRAVGWIAGIAAVLVAGAVATAIVLGGASTPGGSEPSPAPSTAPVVADAIPTPELVGSPQADGTNLTFTVANPDPEADDRFVWRVSNRAQSEAVRPAEGDTIVVADYAAGSTVCVEVSVLRAGKTSPRPLEECYPQ
jgi:hypothetical protein